jgi:DNA invertase Pin-like site-specific DNA recombinase
MTSAAVYARKSTDDKKANAELKSVTRQVANARAFAARRGWVVAEAHVYQDDAISGAEFERRPGFQKMLAAAKRGEFSILVVEEQKALGRESSETPYWIKKLSERGVEIWGCLEDRCVTPRSATDKLTSMVRSFADESERTNAALRVREGHKRYAERGAVVGGRLYGYRNVKKYADAEAQIYTHTAREIDEPEARVVRRIFSMYAEGHGLRAVAKTLTAERVASPRYTPHEGLSPVGAWTPSTVAAVLDREHYHGVVVWNKHQKRDSWGKIAVTARPESEWVRTEAESLRIVPEDLWLRVAARRRTAHEIKSTGRPRKDRELNLLAGIAVCATCGGGLVAESGSYSCARRRHSGACENGCRVRVADANERVLLAIEEHVLTPARVAEFLLATERAERDGSNERERRDIEKRIARVVDAIEQGQGDAPTLVARLRDLEARRASLAAEKAIPQPSPRVVASALKDWRERLRGNVETARDVLRRLVAGRIAFTPMPGGLGYTFRAPTRFSGLLEGAAIEESRLPAYIKRNDARGRDDAEIRSLETAFEKALTVGQKAATEKVWRPQRVPDFIPELEGCVLRAS